MKSSDLLLNKIIDFEGCKLTAYKCPAGVWTIGVGHTDNIKLRVKITSKNKTFCPQDIEVIKK